MTILNLGLSGTIGSTSTSEGYRVYEREDSIVGSAGHDVYLVWATERDETELSSFTFTFNWRGWKKGASGVSSWSNPMTETVPVDNIQRRKPHRGGKTWWYCPLASFDFMGAAAPGGLRYDKRSSDQIEVQVSMYGHYASDGNVLRTTRKARGNLYIGYIPTYEITGIMYEKSNMVVIEYDTTWERQDDRYCIEEAFIVGDKTPILKARTWGTIDAPGRIKLPTDLLNQHIKGKTVFLDIRFNAAYRPADLDFASAKGGFAVEDHTVCNTPTLTLVESEDPYSVSVRTGDSRDVGAPIEKVTVKMLGGQYKADETTVDVGEIATLRFCPFGQPIVIEAVGDGEKDTSYPVQITVPAINVKNGISVLDSIEGGSRAILEYNQAFDVKATGEKEIVKLARKRPSAFYGTGGATTVRMQATLVDESGVSIEKMPEQGDMMLRLQDGRRYALAAEVGISWDSPRIRNVTISGDEVSA